MTKQKEVKAVADPSGSRELLGRIKGNLSKAIVGKEKAIDLVLAALLCGGHVLIEDVPGLGKTTLVSALAKSLTCTFRRIQFTPDVLPADVTGYTVYNMKTGEKEIRFGAVMGQIVLADEINRTSPKTQSSLLEAMQEAQVTIDGETYPLQQPFMVLATQNPVELTGTYPLPEAQLDRFLMKISMGYPSLQEEMDILSRNKESSPLDSLSPVAEAADILCIRQEVRNITCVPAVMEYIVRIAERTRQSEQIAMGISPRGSLALMNASMAWALLQGRDYVLPDDVQAMAQPVLTHRLVLGMQADTGAHAAAEILDKIIQSISVPSVS